MKTIIIIIALASSFMPGKVESNLKAKITTYTISYYWFDVSGNYIRQNTLLTEATITGYSNNTSNPKTLRERGYDPANCIPGSPPVPIDPSLPDEVLFSHP